MTPRMRLEVLELADRLSERAAVSSERELADLARRTYTRCGELFAEAEPDDPAADLLRWTLEACSIAARQCDRGCGSHAVSMLECAVSFLDDAAGGER